MKRLTHDQWIEKYKPIKNHIDENASMGGYMFETFGKEIDFVLDTLRKTPEKVWTMIEGDSVKQLYIVRDYHLVNRIGYFITELDAEDGYNDVRVW